MLHFKYVLTGTMWFSAACLLLPTTGCNSETKPAQSNPATGSNRVAAAPENPTADRIVHAHGHQIDTDRTMPQMAIRTWLAGIRTLPGIGRICHLSHEQLRSHPIGA